MSRFGSAFGKKKPKIHAVVNENSGKSKGRKRERDIILGMLKEAFGDDQHPDPDLVVFPTRNLSELEEAKDVIRIKRPDIIAIFGGDGTIQKLLGEEDGLLNDLMRHGRSPLFIFYGFGSTNTIKNELKVLGKDQIKATAKIIKKIKLGWDLEVINRNILRINDRHGFIYGSGLPATFLERYNAKSPKGPWRVLKIGAWWGFTELFRLLPYCGKNTVARKVPVSHEFWSEEHRIDGSGESRMISEGIGNRSSIVASSLEQVGLGCKLTYRAEEELGHFHAILSSLGFWGSAAKLPDMFRGNPLTGSVDDAVVTKLVLKYGEPILHTIDGERFDAEDMTDTVTIECGPRLKIVRG